MARRKGRLWQRGWPDHPSLKRSVSVRVPFQDADPTGMAWHGSYFRFYDTARVEVLRALKFSYRDMAASGQIWPIVDTRVRYLKSVPFGDQIEVTAQLVEWEFRLLIYYEILDESGTRLNEAYTVQVPVAAEGEKLIIGLPDNVRAEVEALVKNDGKS